MTAALPSTKSVWMAVEAELNLAVATVQVVHFELMEPIDKVVRENGDYRLDMCITPRTPNARMCFYKSTDPSG